MRNMEAEFLESEVMFSGSDSDSEQNPQSPNKHHTFGYSYRNSYSKEHHTPSLRKTKRSSIPLNIPGNISPKPDMLLGGNDEDDYEDDSGEMVPPHLIVARRDSVKTGSNLRGRNLRQVRNSILRMTGFLES